MQRTIYNVWGRWTKYHTEANERLQLATSHNPKITNLHIEIKVEHIPYTAIPGTRGVVYYQARWYDRQAAIKAGRARRNAPKAKRHVCNCSYCEL